jgi:hypothetical protein
MLPNAKNRQLLSVTLDLKSYERCNDWRKLLIEQIILEAVRAVSLEAMHEITEPVSEILNNILNLILLWKFPIKPMFP